MKILIFGMSLLIAVVLLIACAGDTKSIVHRKDFQETYLNQFKLIYFRQLLDKSYNHSSAVQQIIDADYSGFTEAILTESDLNLIDSLTTLDNEYLKVDSARGTMRAEGSDGKRPLGYIMDKLRSKWLDSLAKRRWKINKGANIWTDE